VPDCQALTTDNLMRTFQMWDTTYWRKLIALLFVTPTQFVVCIKAIR
jgi:hypothetical protein